MSEEIHLSELDDLSEAVIDRAYVADMALSLQGMDDVPIDWLSVASRMLNMRVADDLWAEWYQSPNGDTASLYKLVVSDMVFGTGDNVITTVDELNALAARYDEALAAREALADKNPSREEDEQL